MKHILSGISLSSRAPVWSCALLTLILLFLPTGFEENLVFQESDIRPALVLSTDGSAPGNSAVSWRSCLAPFRGGPRRAKTL